MGLSYLFTSVAHFVLEKLWPRPSCALLTSSSSTFFMILTKWVLMPLISSLTESLVVAVTPVSSKISLPMLASAIPSKNFYFFELLVAGRFVTRKFLSTGVTLF